MHLNIPAHWRYLLEGLGETDTGEVITRDGEIIGAWRLVDGVFYSFTPNGASEHIFFEPHLGMLTLRIAEWRGDVEPPPA